MRFILKYTIVCKTFIKINRGGGCNYANRNLSGAAARTGNAKKVKE